MKQRHIINAISDEKLICSICGKEYVGYGNNAQPVNDRLCCDECNLKVVIPYRIYLMRTENRKNKKNATSYKNNKSFTIK